MRLDTSLCKHESGIVLSAAASQLSSHEYDAIGRRGRGVDVAEHPCHAKGLVEIARRRPQASACSYESNGYWRPTETIMSAEPEW
jgi:hypothetical protein